MGKINFFEGGLGKLFKKTDFLRGPAGSIRELCGTEGSKTWGEVITFIIRENDKFHFWHHLENQISVIIRVCNNFW